MQGGRQERVSILRVALIAFSLCMIVAFSAEPSTSTVFDIREGRGVAVVHGTSPARTAAAASALADGLSVALAAVVVALVAGAGGRVATHRWVRCDVDVPPPRLRLRWGALARRGPPALV